MIFKIFIVFNVIEFCKLISIFLGSISSTSAGSTTLRDGSDVGAAGEGQPENALGTGNSFYKIISSFFTFTDMPRIANYRQSNGTKHLEVELQFFIHEALTIPFSESVKKQIKNKIQKFLQYMIKEMN